MSFTPEQRIHEQRYLYWLRNPLGEAFHPSVSPAFTSTQLRSFALGLDSPTAPLVLEWESGEKIPTDLIWLSLFTVAVSPRCLQVLNGFTGWTTFPVEIIDGFGRSVADYRGLVITGRCARARNNLNRIETLEDSGYQSYVGLIIDPDGWDGSDVFAALLGPWPFVTQRLHNAFRQARIDNCDFELLTEVRMSKAMIDRLSDAN